MAKTLFEHIDAIYQYQKPDYFSTLNDADIRTYSNYMVNRFLSMNMHQLPIVNEIQKYNISPETHYLFYSNILPRGKQYNKYVKAKKEHKYESWVIELVAKYYEVSQDEAVTYIELYQMHDKEGLKELCRKYGVDEKTIKKAKL